MAIILDSLELYVIITLIVSGCFFILCISNIRWMKKNTCFATLKNGPKVSVLVPARNEENCLASCIEHLLNQDYQNYNIYILDDTSADRTFEIVNSYAMKYPDKITVVKGKPLPIGWNGKTNAMQQLVEIADGDIFVFTDADTKHKSTSISWAVTNLLFHKADFISGYVYEEMETFGEKIVIPAMFMLTGFVVPIWLNNKIKFPILSTAVGQFIAVKKDSFIAAGGYEPVKQTTTEDIYLARYMRSKGYSTYFLDIKDHVSCRMYEGYHAAVRGISKNIFDFLGKKTFLLFGIIAAVLLFLVMPSFIVPQVFGMNPRMGFYLLISVVLFFLTWFFLLKDRGMNPLFALLSPLLFFHVVLMAIYAFYRTVSGQGFYWKGRKVK